MEDYYDYNNCQTMWMWRGRSRKKIVRDLWHPVLFQKRTDRACKREKSVWQISILFLGERQVDDMMSMVADDMNLKGAWDTEKKHCQHCFEDQPCIVIGRASDYAYKEHPDAVRIFLCGDKKTRISKIAKKHQVSELKAKMIVDDTDRRRKQYHNYYSGETWGLADNYDLCLDECKLGIDGVAAVVSAYIGQIDGKDW